MNDNDFVDIAIDVEDFDSDDCQLILRNLDDTSYFLVALALMKKAEEAFNNKNIKQGKIYWLLAGACSMSFFPNTPHKAFKPSIVWGNQRSISIDDFEESDMLFFSNIITQIQDPKLQARIADIVWTRKKHNKYATAAIVAYCRIPLDSKSWKAEEYKCWQRAMTMAKYLGKAGISYIKNIEKTVYEKFIETFNTGLGKNLAEFLYTFDLARDKAIVIAEKMEMEGIKIQKAENFPLAESYFKIAAIWYRKGKNQNKHIDMIIRVADTQVAMATRNYHGAGIYYDKAIQTLRTIPKEDRSSLGIDERIQELYTLMTQCNTFLVDSLSTTSIKIDISKQLEDVIGEASGKSLIDSLILLTSYKFFCVADMEEMAKESINKSFLSSFF